MRRGLFLVLMFLFLFNLSFGSADESESFEDIIRDFEERPYIGGVVFQGSPAEHWEEGGEVVALSSENPCAVDACTLACREYMPENVRELIDYPDYILRRLSRNSWGDSYPYVTSEDIKGYCSGNKDLDPSLKLDFNGGDRDKFIERAKQHGILPERIPEDEFVWNPKNDVNDGEEYDDDGENYCEEYWEDESRFDFDGFGAKEDCVCWIELPCLDKDGDGYGITSQSRIYNYMCENPEEDCVDSESEVHFDFWAMPDMAYYYRRGMDRDSDGEYAEHIKPGVEETPKLHRALREDLREAAEDWSGGAREPGMVSSCTDGVDNDCDGFVDCDESSCGREDPLCEGTCGNKCSKRGNMEGSRCFDKESIMTEGEIDEDKIEEEMGEGDFLFLPDSNDITDCKSSDEKKCVCKIRKTNCSEERVNKAEELETEMVDTILFKEPCREWRKRD